MRSTMKTWHGIPLYRVPSQTGPPRRLTPEEDQALERLVKEKLKVSWRHYLSAPVFSFLAFEAFTEKASRDKDLITWCWILFAVMYWVFIADTWYRSILIARDRKDGWVEQYGNEEIFPRSRVVWTRDGKQAVDLQ